MDKAASFRGSQRGGTVRRAGLATGCCLTVAAAGCGASGAAGTSGPADAEPLAAASSPAVTGVSRHDLRLIAASYLAIARPANDRLDVEFDSYADHEHDDLAAAKRDLLAQAATERHFDRQLVRLQFPPWIAITATALVRANTVRISLTRRQARATSLASLRGFDHRHHAADAAVEKRARLIRQFLGLPPPSTS
jgi:hypothetical protein